MVTSSAGLSTKNYETLAAFRYSLRRFMRIADENAKAAGVTPRQHQALLAIKGGFPGLPSITIGQLAENLLIKNHSAVELVARLAAAGLASRRTSDADRREVLLTITPKGHAVLRSLSSANLDQLRLAAPVFSSLLQMLFEAGFGEARTMPERAGPGRSPDQ
jgi:DNA-binding MarR family transcriptional regulator